MERQQYDMFRRRVFGGRVREAGWFEEELNIAATPEIELQSLWFGGAFGTEFVDTLGRAVKVVQFGHWNHSAGPDFLHAAVEVDGERMLGAIELDTDVRDWEHHKHSTNPEYDDVVLHLFFNVPNDSFFTKTSSFREVVQVRLDAADLVASRASADAHPGACLQPLREMNDANLRALLRGAALSRAARKAKRFQVCAGIHGRREAWYQALAEVLGYRHNKLPMKALAQALPIADLLKEGHDSREARMLGLAGFLDDIATDETVDADEYLRNLWGRWWRTRPDGNKEVIRGLEWRTAGVRPSNHPQRRIGALAAVVERWSGFERLVDGSMESIAKGVKAFSSALDHEFWSSHYTLRSAAMKKPMSLIGEERWRDFLANVVLPVAMNDERADAARTVYFALKSAQRSEPLKIACLRLFGSEDRAAALMKKHAEAQGILAVFDDFCLRDASGCDECSFPSQLAQWQEGGHT